MHNPTKGAKAPVITTPLLLAVLEEKQLLKKHLVLEEGLIRGISYDSREVAVDSLFFCKGNFKESYLVSASKAGATYYMAEEVYHLPGNPIEGIIVTDIRKAMAVTSALFYGYPQKQLKTVAFTGTKGKTSTNYFTKTIFEEAYPGKVAYLTTFESVLGNEAKDRFPSNLTTPESLDLFKYMRQAVDNGMAFFLMEVSSQAYKLDRVYDLTFDIGVFLNISPDHIGPDEHQDFEEYLACKMQLLKNSRQCILNAQTDHFDIIYPDLVAYNSSADIYLYQDNNAPKKHESPLSLVYQGKATAETVRGTEFSLISQRGSLESLNGEYRLAVQGDFNIGNAIAAGLVASLCGISKMTIQKGLLKTKIPGRMEVLQSKSNLVYVDYAHNYLSLKTVLQFLKDKHGHRKVTVIAGCPGNKAQSRRSDFGRVFSEYGHRIVLTSDDPDWEDPHEICLEIKAAITNPSVQVKIEVDRKKAIHHAISSLESDEILLVAGKGPEVSQKIKGKKIPYLSDVKIIEAFLNRGTLEVLG